MEITAIFQKPSPCRETYERLVGAKGQARRMATNKLDSDRSCDLHQYPPPRALDPILPAVREKKAFSALFVPQPAENIASSV